MKFVCMKCESFMEFQKVENPAEQSLGVSFACPTCGAKVAMVTNAGETAMVQALGVKIGGRDKAAEPMELIRGNLKEGEGVTKPEVTAEMQQEMLKAEMAKMAAGTGDGTPASGCPFSGMVAKMQGSTATPSATPMTWTPEAKERIEKVPSFMRPMIEMGIENYARKNGITTISPEVMDASKNDMGEMVWSKEAEERLDNIPSFIRPMAKKEIERIAKEKGMTEITNALMEETKSKFIGMGY
ncbi:MAG: PCP reductase family protein [Nitrospirota bacterium]